MVHTEWRSAWSKFSHFYLSPFIDPLLFIPSEARVTPLLSGIYLRNKFIWLDPRSVLNNFWCFTELELLYKQQTFPSLLNRLIPHLEVVFVMKKLQRHQINNSVLQIKHHRMLSATGEKRMMARAIPAAAALPAEAACGESWLIFFVSHFHFPEPRKKKHLN